MSGLSYFRLYYRTRTLTDLVAWEAGITDRDRSISNAKEKQ